MYTEESTGVLPEQKGIKYILDYDEWSEFEVSRMYDDFRGAGEFEMDSWVVDVEPLFSLSEIFSLFVK